MGKLLALVMSLLLAAAPAGNPLPPQPVVVELFTSEGCSSCPPADRLLTALASSKEDSAIIPLGFHVDYWDDGGWKDRFSSHRYTQRQERYSGHFGLNSVYTPQIVIDGRKELVGNDDGAVRNAIRRAAAQSKPAHVTLNLAAGDTLSVAVDLASASSGQPPAQADVLLAITEDDLTTAVKGGENTARTLHHSAVVRELHSVGSLTNGKFAGDQHLALDPAWRRDRLHAVLLLQQRDNGAILGAAQTSLAGSR